jgi:hypothetical protein
MKQGFDDLPWNHQFSLQMWSSADALWNLEQLYWFSGHHPRHSSGSGQLYLGERGLDVAAERQAVRFQQQLLAAYDIWFYATNKGGASNYIYSITVTSSFDVTYQKTSREWGQSAVVCPGLSQSWQNNSFELRVFVGIRTSSFNRLQLNMSCPGRSQISQTSSPPFFAGRFIVVVEEALSRLRLSGVSVVFLLLLYRASLSFNLSTSCSSSSYQWL